MRPRPRSLVTGANVASAATVHGAGEAEAGAHVGEFAARLPPSADGPVRIASAIGALWRQSTVRPNKACWAAAKISVSAPAQPTITAAKAGTFARRVSIR